MAVKTLIKISEYHDSVSLMLVARELSKLEGIKDAAVVMGTEANRSILNDAGLLTEEANAASPNDLVIAVAATSDSVAEAALQKAEALLKHKASSGQTGEFKPRTIRGALSTNPTANVAVISVPGRYAAEEAWDALSHGLHVLLFSDNVSLEDEGRPSSTTSPSALPMCCRADRWGSCPRQERACRKSLRCLPAAVLGSARVLARAAAT
jgi:FdrA protein